MKSIRGLTGGAVEESERGRLKDNPDAFLLRTSLADVMGRLEGILIRAVREGNAVLDLSHPFSRTDLHQRVRLFYGAALLHLSQVVFKSMHFRLHLHEDGIGEPELLDYLIKIFSGDFFVDGVGNPVDEGNGSGCVCGNGCKCSDKFRGHGFSSCAGTDCVCKQPHPTTQDGTVI